MKRIAAVVAVGVLAWQVASGAGGNKTSGPSKEAVEKAQEKVKQHLEKIRGTGGQIERLADPSLAQVFPSDVFFVVRYRLFPVARELPEGLRAANIFVVDKDGTLTHVKDNKALEKFFKDRRVAVKNEDQGRDALASWLMLAQEFHQDGMFKFEVNKKNFAVEKAGDDVSAIGRAVVMQGGNGELNVKLNFEGGKLTKVAESAKIIPGPRPICQATKLLDADPIVRRMVENDLLYLGDLVKDYLDEQRARATPELREAIDRIWRRIEQQQR